MKRVLIACLAALSLAACAKPADVASENLSTAADNFQVPRRIVFFNGITDKYLLTIEGLCSLGNNDSAGQLTVTCKTDKGYRKHFLGLSDNVSFFVEQVTDEAVSTYRYQVIFNPASIIPDIRLNAN